ncbi:MAG: hypothetical protein A2600_00985 [Candidatus Lambdaproteobacteria bacterium RIFOXYD1_FULL_56_27]|uniref:PPC domain-containing protein n=1 Tax=Candidatus Lambdaproteobacteria bacterium RIFOXYD2_FULL_56_26 TaxID=1817773 RepID=A0A1F6GSP5_9PROT|nr:MAG: hypothetical protein A2557_00100 [Candidatus Lambdaproteobacteria bacterium RIFOXYD2_FULL_56_26]OGH01315.1 MAG: hypothetical protein A2426_12935 [Candidatus Lambdaproteobacteria bacterium RIFOXYC1_FULL_56_13]OGH06855.1 MAG: hypothetical protein A2600_00985 [Candidatus Lambdaproteobacteria bacterium RIFOXYD1_FULL_56_27]
MRYAKTESQIFVSLEPGEAVQGSLVALATELGLGAAWVQGIGVIDRLELGFYQRETRDYKTQRFDGDFEVLTLVGNLSTKEGAPFLHLHGSFSGPDFLVRGGHFLGGQVSVSAEFVLQPSSLPIQRKYSPQSNLFLWDL